MNLYRMLKRLYDAGKLPAENLKNAAALGWITAEEYKRITEGDGAPATA